MIGILMIFFAAFGLGVYLILVHNDYWVGLPLLGFGSTIIAVLLLAGIYTIKIYLKEKFKIKKDNWHV